MHIFQKDLAQPMPLLANIPLTNLFVNYARNRKQTFLKGTHITHGSISTHPPHQFIQYVPNEQKTHIFQKDPAQPMPLLANTPLTKLFAKYPRNRKWTFLVWDTHNPMALSASTHPLNSFSRYPMNRKCTFFKRTQLNPCPY